MIIILLLAALISFIVALGEHERSAFFEPLLILLIVVLNAIMGVIQENKAEKAMDALLKLSSPHARVIREGKQQMVDAKDLVVLVNGHPVKKRYRFQEGDEVCLLAPAGGG